MENESKYTLKVVLIHGQNHTGKNKEPCDRTQCPFDSHVFGSPPFRESHNTWKESIFHAKI